MRSIKIENPTLNSFITDLGVDYSSGVTLTVRSNNSFAANDLVVIGNPTEELTELKKVDSLTGNTILTLASALKFTHNKATPVYKTMWDQISIEGRSSSAGVFAEITQSAIQWDSKTNKTIYFHQAGTDSYEYRFRFYNSVTLTYSEYSPTLSGAGFTKNQMGYIIAEARRIAGDKERRIINTEELLMELTRAKNIIRGHKSDYWFWKVDGYINDKSIIATAGESVFSLDSIDDLSVIDTIEYKYTSGSTNQKWTLKRKTDVEIRKLSGDLNRPAMDFPRYFRLLPADANSAKGYFEIPTPILNNGVGTFYVSYYKEEEDYTDVSNTTSIVIPGILRDYLISVIFATKGNDTRAQDYMDKFIGPENRKKTLAMEKLSGLALLDALDEQYKKTQGQPMSLMSFRGQKYMSKFYGNRTIQNPDYLKEYYFPDEY